jgi:hypothetical protein
MQLRLVQPNAKDPVILEYRDRTRILFSYEAPVAAFVPGRGFICTNIDVSNTTATRIHKFVGNAPCEQVEQAEIFGLITRHVPPTRDQI